SRVPGAVERAPEAHAVRLEVELEADLEPAPEATLGVDLRPPRGGEGRAVGRTGAGVEFAPLRLLGASRLVGVDGEVVGVEHVEGLEEQRTGGAAEDERLL